MGLLSPILRNGTDGRLTWWCPGCDGAHTIQTGGGSGPRWDWNGDAERPTFSPSVHCSWSEPSGAKVCHTFVREGRIQFLADCTHELAGQTVPMPPWPVPDWRDA